MAPFYININESALCLEGNLHIERNTIGRNEHCSKERINAWRFETLLVHKINTYSAVTLYSTTVRELPSARLLFLITSPKRENLVVNDYINK